MVVQGRKPDEQSGSGAQLLHVGIAQRGFERRFELADFVRVADAQLEDGLLIIDLLREVPDAMKPRKITIGGNTPLSVVEGAAAEKTDKAA